MKFRMWKVFAVLSLLMPLQGLGQLFCLGGGCDCGSEKQPEPNLFVDKPVHVTGVLIEEISQSPYVMSNTVVEVRNLETKSVLIHVKVDHDGRFDLGAIPAGKYRLLPARERDVGQLERMPLTDPPKPMFCSGESECTVVAVEHIHGTDMPFEFCPPK